jgi:glycosyltransferase involved in cell wall biosynthesis
LPETIKQLSSKLSSLREKNLISVKSKILFVDDGSRDNTWELLCNYFNEYDCVTAIRLSRNVGHQKALLAGLMFAKDHSDLSITIDADLQDDIEAIDTMIEKHCQGCDVVYGVRNKRQADCFFKRTTAQFFYKFLKLMGANIIHNHADFRLMSKRAMIALSEYGETNLFLRGMIPLIGFPSDCVFYERAKRFAGKTKYPFNKMLSFAFDGITSFSIKPLRMISRLGVFISLLSVLGMVYALASKIISPETTVSGWTALMISVWFIGGIQMLCIGVVGEYVGKVFNESKARPHYHIESCLSKETHRDES